MRIPGTAEVSQSRAGLETSLSEANAQGKAMDGRQPATHQSGGATAKLLQQQQQKQPHRSDNNDQVKPATTVDDTSQMQQPRSEAENAEERQSPCSGRRGDKANDDEDESCRHDAVSLRSILSLMEANDRGRRLARWLPRRQAPCGASAERRSPPLATLSPDARLVDEMKHLRGKHGSFLGVNEKANAEAMGEEEQKEDEEVVKEEQRHESDNNDDAVLLGGELRRNRRRRLSSPPEHGLEPRLTEHWHASLMKYMNNSDD